MQYQANTPSEYLEQLERDWRKSKLLEIRHLIMSSGYKLHETVEYRMLAFKMNDRTVFHLNAQRAYVSLYVGDISKIEGAVELLKEFDKGKGCIRVRKNDPIQDSGLEEFVRKTLRHWAEGGETLC